MNEKFFHQVKQLYINCASRKSLAFHFINKSKKHLNEFFNDKENVVLKKYFYVIIPLLSIYWMMINEDKIFPPTNFIELLDELEIEETKLTTLKEMIKSKKEDPNFSNGPRIIKLDEWINEMLPICEEYAKKLPQQKTPPSTEFNEILCYYIKNH